MVPLFDVVTETILPENVQVIVKLANIVLDKEDEQRMKYDGGS